MNEDLPEVIVDGKPIKPNTIWYHYQKIPKPGGHNYEVRILADSQAINKISRIVECAVSNPRFEEKAARFNESTFNCVQMILSYLPAEERQGWHVEWVFNTIDEVSVKDGIVYIKGRCSEAVDDFDKYNR